MIKELKNIERKMKNIVVWTAVKNEEHSIKYGGWDWFDYSRRTWQYWCNKNNVQFIEYTEPMEKDLMKHRVTWQRWFDVFDLLPKEYDNVWMIDSASMIKWNAPTIFDYCDGRMIAFRDMDNLSWVYNSVQCYQQFFNYEFDMNKYFNCGNVIFNKKHKDFFKEIVKLYWQNQDWLIESQTKIIKLGTDQTPVNYLAQIHNIDINLELPFVYDLTHIHKKEMFGYNWQLKEDTTSFFIKYGYVWRFNGLPKHYRSEIMLYTWTLIKDNYV